MTDSNLVWMRLLYVRASGLSDTAMTAMDGYGHAPDKRRTWRFWAKR